MMTELEYVFCTIGTLGGAAAFGCWLLGQSDAAYTPKEGPTVFLVLVGGIVVFIGMMYLSAYSAEDSHETSAVVKRMLFLMGVCGAIAVFFFIVVSFGMVFLFSPLPAILLAVFVLLALLFKPKETSDGGAN
jgi:uncharacterized membrane protein